MSKLSHAAGWLVAGALGAALVLKLAPSPPATGPAPVARSEDAARLARLEAQLAAIQAENARLATAMAVDRSPARAPRPSPGGGHDDDAPRVEGPSMTRYTEADEERARARLTAHLQRRTELIDSATAEVRWPADATAEVRRMFLAEAEQGAELFATARREGDFGGASRRLHEIMRDHDEQVRDRLGDDGLAVFHELRERANRREP